MTTFISMSSLSITVLGTWWEKLFLTITLCRITYLSHVTWSVVFCWKSQVSFIYPLPSSLTQRRMLVLTSVSFIMHATEHEDPVIKRVTVITTGIQEVLRVKMQHISTITLPSRAVSSDSVQTEFTWMRSLRLHETANVFIQMKWKMFTLLENCLAQ